MFLFKSCIIRGSAGAGGMKETHESFGSVCIKFAEGGWENLVVDVAAISSQTHSRRATGCYIFYNWKCTHFHTVEHATWQATTVTLKGNNHNTTDISFTLQQFPKDHTILQIRPFVVQLHIIGETSVFINNMKSININWIKVCSIYHIYNKNHLENYILLQCEIFYVR